MVPTHILGSRLMRYVEPSVLESKIPASRAVNFRMRDRVVNENIADDMVRNSIVISRFTGIRPMNNKSRPLTPSTLSYVGSDLPSTREYSEPARADVRPHNVLAEPLKVLPHLANNAVHRTAFASRSPALVCGTQRTPELLVGHNIFMPRTPMSIDSIPAIALKLVTT